MPCWTLEHPVGPSLCQEPQQGSLHCIHIIEHDKPLSSEQHTGAKQQADVLSSEHCLRRLGFRGVTVSCTVAGTHSEHAAPEAEPDYSNLPRRSGT